MKLYTIFDKEAEEHNERLITTVNDNVAKRILKTSMSQDKTLMMSAKAYELIYLGLFDKETGTLTPDRRKVCELQELKDELLTEE
ncbi:nonstructural protein [Peromfec virus RodF8_26]|uniref:Nonstructural protein n=1 Tax=Peromfec virus RodF8_26 TaxID=2929365 RepID=A0A976R897_9VIRU|nr:nonstructural protein [Peromfec virus RodF8_26]